MWLNKLFKLMQGFMSLFGVLDKNTETSFLSSHICIENSEALHLFSSSMEGGRERNELSAFHLITKTKKKKMFLFSQNFSRKDDKGVANLFSSCWIPWCNLNISLIGLQLIIKPVKFSCQTEWIIYLWYPYFLDAPCVAPGEVTLKSW